MLTRILVASAAMLALAASANAKGHARPGPAACHWLSESGGARLFDRWNRSLTSGDAEKVADNYAPKSILLPTLSNTPRLTREEKLDYFHHFLERKPEGRIDMRMIQTGCNAAFDAGLYTFTFGDGSAVKARYTYTYGYRGGRWLITSHHSSAMPEK